MIGGGAMFGLLALADATDWLTNPGISIPVLAVLSLGGAVLAAMAFAPLSVRPVLVSALVGGRPVGRRLDPVRQLARRSELDPGLPARASWGSLSASESARSPAPSTGATRSRRR